MRLTHPNPVSFVENNWKTITVATCAIPVAVEIGYLAYTAIKNRKEVKANAISTYHQVIDSFKCKEGETKGHYRRRVIKNVAITMLAIAAISGVFVAAFWALPTTLAIPIAISTIILAGKAIYRCKEIKAKALELKNVVVQSLVRGEKETKKEYTKRVLKNVFISALFLTAVAGVSAAAFTFLPTTLAVPVALTAASLLLNGFTKRKEILTSFIRQEDESKADAAKRITKNVLNTLLMLGGLSLTLFVLPSVAKQWESLFSGALWVKITGTSAIIAAEYFLVGVAHLMLSVYHFSKSNKAEGCFHLSCGLLAFALPIRRIALDGAPRMHHDFLGLLISLAPFRSVQMLGTAYTVDSMLYHINVNGGGRDDFANIMVENYSLILPSIAIGCMLQLVSSLLKTEKDDKEAAPDKKVSMVHA